jgi:hypothetical protein
MHTTGVSYEKSTALISAASQIISSIESAGCDAGGDLGFTVYSSLSGDFCVDFVPPAVDLSVNVSDRLMEVDGVSTRGKTLADVTNMMRGRVGSYAAIKLFRFPQTGAPFFVETSLLRLPVLSEELRASMYPNYTTSRKKFADIASKAASQAEEVASQSQPPAHAQTPAPPPAASASSTSAPPVSSTDLSLLSSSPSLHMESIHVFTKESLAQVITRTRRAASRSIWLRAVLLFHAVSHLPDVAAALALDCGCRGEDSCGPPVTGTSFVLFPSSRCHRKFYRSSEKRCHRTTTLKLCMISPLQLRPSTLRLFSLSFMIFSRHFCVLCRDIVSRLSIAERSMHLSCTRLKARSTSSCTCLWRRYFLL